MTQLIFGIIMRGSPCVPDTLFQDAHPVPVLLYADTRKYR